MDPEAFDQALRDVALTQQLDLRLLDLAGYTEQQKTRGDPKHYFPRILSSGFNAPPDLSAARRRILQEMDSGFIEVSASLPAEFKADDAGHGFKVRAMLLVAAMGHDISVQETLRKTLNDDQTKDVRIRAAAAAGLLLQGQEVEVLAWMRGQTDPAMLGAVFSAMASHDDRRLFADDDPKHFVEYMSPASILGRQLDNELLIQVARVAAMPNNREVYMAGLEALTSRLDNPAIKQYVLTVLTAGTDDDAASRILSLNLPLNRSPEYATAVLRFVDSPNPTLAVRAICALGVLQGERFVERVLPLLGHPNRLYARAAAVALQDCGAYMPERSIQALKTAMQERGNDDDFRSRAEIAIEMIQECLQHQESNAQEIKRLKQVEPWRFEK